jgi:hypothetical protein
MKKFTASWFLIVAASVWIFLGSIALFSYRNSDLPAIQYAGILLLLDGFLLIALHPMDSPQGLNVLIGAIGWTAGLLYLYDAYRFSKIDPGPSYLKAPNA